MMRYPLPLCVAALALLGFGFAIAADSARPATSQPTLRQAAQGHFLVGGAIMSNALDKPAVADLLATQLTTLTAENEFKPASVQPRPGVFNFNAADRIADFAQQHQIALVGHTLCWHEQTPRWMFADAAGNPLPREQALANLKAHIQAVAGHFKGKVKGWDVVNEALDDGPGYLRETPAKKAIGEDFPIKAFQFAHEADPNAELYYNDYSIEGVHKREKAIRLIRELKAAGVRIDGVGIQAHWSMNWPDAKTVEEAILAYKAEGVHVMFTELDMDVLPRKNKEMTANIAAREAASAAADPYKQGIPPAVLQKQADRYADYFRLFLKHQDVVTRVTLWGVGDGQSWLNDFPVAGRTNYPLLWDRQFRPKPAYFSVLSVLQQAPKPPSPHER